MGTERASRGTRGRRWQFERLEPRRMLSGVDESLVLRHGDLEAHATPAPPAPQLADAPPQAIVARNNGATVAVGSKHPLSALPALNSLPGAAASLYLDFDGHFEAQWGAESNVSTPVFDRDGDPTTFDDGELAAIREIWNYVAEDFAPFQLNVTTVADLSKHQLRVAIGGDGAWLGATYGGIGYPDTFTNSIVNTVYVFPKNLANGDPRLTAQAASHEAGHGFGLEHQSQPDSAGRAPIMGEGYDALRGIWWQGKTTLGGGAEQDDISVIARAKNGFGIRTDDHGDSAATASQLTVTGVTGRANGILSSVSDRDYFTFTTAATTVTISAATAGIYANLDVRLELRDESGGRLLAVSDPPQALDATIETPLSAGTYRVVVASHGAYGDVGQYSIDVDFAPIPDESSASGTVVPMGPALPTHPPAAPTESWIALAASYQVKLAWQDGSNNEAGFKVERSTDEGRTWHDAGTVEADVHWYADHSAQPGRSYWYRVRSFNATGRSTSLDVLTVRTPDLPTTPLYGPAPRS